MEYDEQLAYYLQTLEYNRYEPEPNDVPPTPVTSPTPTSNNINALLFEYINNQIENEINSLNQVAEPEPESESESETENQTSANQSNTIRSMLTLISDSNTLGLLLNSLPINTNDTEQNDTETEQNDTETEQNDTETEQNDTETEQNDTETEQNDTDTEQNDTETEQNDIDTEQNDIDTEQNDIDTEQNDIDQNPTRNRRMIFSSYVINSNIESFNLLSSMLLLFNNNTVQINQENQEAHQIHMENKLFLDKIKIYIYKKLIYAEGVPPSEKQCCPICYEEFHLNDKCGITNCNHIFHYECIKMWLTEKCRIPICPICRKDLRE
jgi:hypothetical protein